MATSVEVCKVCQVTGAYTATALRGVRDKDGELITGSQSTHDRRHGYFAYIVEDVVRHQLPGPVSPMQPRGRAQACSKIDFWTTQTGNIPRRMRLRTSPSLDGIPFGERRDLRPLMGFKNIISRTNVTEQVPIEWRSGRPAKFQKKGDPAAMWKVHKTCCGRQDHQCFHEHPLHPDPRSCRELFASCTVRVHEATWHGACSHHPNLAGGASKCASQLLPSLFRLVSVCPRS